MGTKYTQTLSPYRSNSAHRQVWNAVLWPEERWSFSADSSSYRLPLPLAPHNWSVHSFFLFFFLFLLPQWIVFGPCLDRQQVGLFFSPTTHLRQLVNSTYYYAVYLLFTPMAASAILPVWLFYNYDFVAFSAPVTIESCISLICPNLWQYLVNPVNPGGFRFDPGIRAIPRFKKRNYALLPYFLCWAFFCNDIVVATEHITIGLGKQDSYLLSHL